MLQHAGMLYFCHTSNSMRYVKPLNRARLFSHRPAFALTTPVQDFSTFTFAAAPGCPISSRLLLFLHSLVRVHQEDRSSSLAKSTPLLKNVLANAPSVSLQHLCCQRHLHRNILVAIVMYIATFWLPSSSTSQHFGCPSYLTTQDVLWKCTPKNVLSKCTVKLVLQASSLLTSSHSGQACHRGTVLWLWHSFLLVWAWNCYQVPHILLLQDTHCGLGLRRVSL